MKTASRTAAARAFLRRAGHPIVLVPTMGALHEGHLALIRRARRAAGTDGTVVVSIFVNPTQFDRADDLAAYPRPSRADSTLCRSEGVDLLFRPTDPSEVYPADASVTVKETALSGHLCGASRPGHFGGVCTVVTKLFHILQPDAAVFGEKDWQQLAIIRRLVRDLDFPIRVIGHPTVRADDGLALSSRNALLSVDQRSHAPRFHAALTSAITRATPAAIRSAAIRAIGTIPGATVDYVSLVDAETLTPARNFLRPTRLAAAIFLGSTRLIDNVGIAPRA